MSQPDVVSAEQWQVARDQLLVREKEATKAMDALAAARRRLPMVEFDPNYLFEGPDGQVRLIDLFGKYRQLAVYQFMNIGTDRFCPGCSQFIDNVGRLEHIQARNATFVVCSNMPFDQIEPFTKRMGWTMPFYSSLGSTFSEDCGCGTAEAGLSIFLRDGDKVYRTYFTTDRGIDRMMWHFNILDVLPYGRQEVWEDSPEGWPQTGTSGWWRLHDEYETTSS